MKPTFRSFVLFTTGTALALGSIALRAADASPRLLNLSTRTQVSPNGGAPIVGFVIGAGAQKQVLVRAVGPTLGSFGVTGTLANPKLELYSGSTKISENDDWSTTSVGGSTTFSSVGAFALNAGTRDAALLATLGPGNYTAMVSGVGTATSGIVLLEVYDVTGAARLMNLSTRAQVGTGGGILISGLSIAPGGGVRKILVRAAGPTLATFNVGGTLADPTIAIIDSNNLQVAANDNWGDNAVALSAAFMQNGAFPFTANSKDSALIADLAPGKNYSIQVSGVGNTTGIALVEVYDLTADDFASVQVAASTATTDTKGAAPGMFTLTRTGATTAPLTVYYNLTGSAIPGVDYASLPGSVTIPAGASTATVNIAASSASASAAINKDATLVLTSGPGYTLGTASAASVTIFYNPGTLYITALRAPTTAAASTAFGTATVQLSSDNTFAIVNVTFSNLSSPETVAYLRIGNPGEVGSELVRLPNGQVNGTVWNLTASGALTPADLVQALKDGRIFLSIESASYPTGELRGAFIQSSGAITFATPEAAPALADTPLTAAQASRFLTQATFGPTKTDIDALTGKRLTDLNAWITAQMVLPASLHLDATRADFNTYTALGDNPQLDYRNRQAAWWKLALSAPDQLRQRVAFALSETLVVSDANTTLFTNALGLANYYDILARGAFGNFRQVLEEVTLSPVMGFYLSSLRNRKATFDARGQPLTSPDENYAREVMQLFSIGLNQLQPDGTLKLDPVGVPIPTYDQKTITEVAKVFTGWGYYSADNNPSFTGAAANWLTPMMLYPAFHEDGVKTIVGGTVLPANQGGAKDLKDTLDALFNHPNTGPFLSRQLIQRLVTSNPSPGYVYRVAQVFANNGTGVRGDLGAVVRAILTDYEARAASVATTASFGKLKEPLLRATALMRALNGGANNGRFQFFFNQGTESNLGQTPLRAPTVFNFFEPNFIQPGVLAAAGLYAPEYQILTDTTAISQPNQLWSWLYANRSGSLGTAVNANEATIGFVFDNTLLALARTPAQLVDYTNLLLAGGGLPTAIRDRIVTAITAMPTSTATAFGTTDLERVRSALYLVATVPQGAIQK